MLQKTKNISQTKNDQLKSDPTLHEASLKGKRAIRRIKQAKSIDPVAQVLLDAADFIKKKGWVRNSLLSNGKVCMLGAIGFAIGPIDGKNENERFFSIKRNLNSDIGKRTEKHLIQHLGNNVPTFNDYQCPNGKTAAQKMIEAANKLL
jgi:hypothetical protein